MDLKLVEALAGFLLDRFMPPLHESKKALTKGGFLNMEAQKYVSGKHDILSELVVLVPGLLKEFYDTFHASKAEETEEAAEVEELSGAEEVVAGEIA
jgi:hypothetical protein